MSNIEKFLDSITAWGYTENPIPPSFFRFKEWVAKGHASSLTYLTDERAELRSDLKKVFPAFQSALVFAFPYTNSVQKLAHLYMHPQWNGLKIASYAFSFGGKDYHLEIRKYLEQVVSELHQLSPQLQCKIAIDTVPILERDLAWRAGLGVFGVNSLLLNRQFGSYFLIGSILLDQKLDLPLASPIEGNCGVCGLCPKRCPAQAIESFEINTSRCFSTYSIETFKPMPPSDSFSRSSWLFGCDVCQQVCPWNRETHQNISTDALTSGEQFLADFWLLRPIEQVRDALNSMSNSQYQKLFYGTSFARTGRIGLLKNLNALRFS